MQKGQTHTVGYAVGVQYAVGMQYTVHSRSWCKKVNSHSGLSKYGWCGPLPLVQKGQTHRVGYAVGKQYAVGAQYAVGMQYAVGTQYAVDVVAKRSTHTVDLANMGGGDRYL